MLFAALVAIVHAESAGTLPGRSSVLYAGPGVTTYGHLQTSGGVSDVPDAMQARLDIYTALGLTERVQLAAYLPLVYSMAFADACKGGCEPVIGVGHAGVQARVKALQDPLQLTAGLGVSSSAWLAPSRGRYTTVGEPTTDVQPALYVGRDVPLGKASGGLVLFGMYTWRLSTWDSALSEDAPRDDVRGGVELHVTTGPVTVMAGAWTLQRLGGAQFDFEDPLFVEAFATDERWAALDYDAVSVGGKLSVALPKDMGLHIALNRVAWVHNGPSDAMDVSLGVHKYFAAR